MRHCLKETIPTSQDKGLAESYKQLPTMFHKASRWYEMCPWTNTMAVII